MSDTGFESVRDIRNAARALRRFANDALVARIFESFEADSGSNLFRSDGNPLADLACRVEPTLKAVQGKMDLDFEQVKKLGEYCRKLSDDAADRMGEVIYDTRHAFLVIGIFLGARIADPTGKALDAVSEGWIRATLAQPRYQGLPKRKKHQPKTSETTHPAATEVSQ